MTATLEIIWDYLINSLKCRLSRYQWLHRFDSTAKKHQVFEKNHHQRQWFINASIRG